MHPNSKSLLLISCCSVIASTSGAPFVPSTSTSSITSALHVRGGAGPLDVKTTAKVATTIFGVQGAYGTLAPSKENELYGLTGDDDILNWLAEGNSSILLCLAIIAYSIFFKDVEPMKAVGVGLITNVVINAKCLLNEEPKKLGIPAITHQLNLVINSIASYALLTNASYASKAAYVLASYCIFGGVQCSLFPDAGVETWNLPNVMTDESKFKLQCMGANATVLGIFIAAIMKGIDPTKAFGYALIPLLLNCVRMMVQIDKEEVSIGSIGLFVWLALTTLFVATLAID